MIELNNISFTYKTGEGTERGAAGGIGEKSSNGSLTNINLKIKDGEFLLLTGGSGCGKTTVLRLINGLIPNFFEGNLQGEILVDGKSISSSELYDTAKTVSTVFQNPRSQFFNVDTTSELAFACENQGMDQKEILQRINQTVTEMQLEPLMNRSLFELSGGQKQKIACASVAVTGNKIILLDEPSANLDNKSVEGTPIVLEGNGSRPSHHGDGYAESETMFSLNTVEQHAVCIGGGMLHDALHPEPICKTLNCMDDVMKVVAYGLDRASFNQGQNAQYDFSVEQELAQTLVSKGPGGY